MRKCLLAALISVFATLGAWAPVHHYELSPHHPATSAAMASPEDMYRLSDMYSSADMYGPRDMY